MMQSITRILDNKAVIVHRTRILGHKAVVILAVMTITVGISVIVMTINPKP
jgi:hypothetical protein